MLLNLSKWIFRVTVVLLWSSPLSIWAESIYYYDNTTGQVDFEETISQNPLGPDENIKSVLIYKTGSSSIHLVQIRFKETPHRHMVHNLIVTLKKGRGILHVDNQGMPMIAGDTAVIPRGAVHYFENTGDEIAAGLGIFVPPYDGTDSIPADAGIQ